MSVKLNGITKDSKQGRGTWTALPGSALSLAGVTQFTQRPDPQSKLSVDIVVPGRKPLPIDPSAPRLTLQQLAKEYGPTGATLKQVRAFIDANGLRPIERTVDSQAIIKVQGTVAQLEKAFNVTLLNFAEPSGEKFFGYRGAISIPSALTGKISGVLGLDDRQVASPRT